MPLKFNRSLNGKQWKTITSVRDLTGNIDADFCFKDDTGGIFKKDAPVFYSPILDRHTGSNKITVSDDYLLCTGRYSDKPTCHGIKSIPLKEVSKTLFTLRLKTINNGFSTIGFCDANNLFDSNTLKNCILWNFKETFVRYYHDDGQMQIRGVNLNTFLKQDDVLNIALDRENNTLSFGVNYNWYPDKPHIPNSERLPFLSDELHISQPVLFIVPSDNCFEIITYEKFKPTYFVDAVSESIFDWYLTEKYYTSKEV